jgi:hypothetical protein
MELTIREMTPADLGSRFLETLTSSLPSNPSPTARQLMPPPWPMCSDGVLASLAEQLRQLRRSVPGFSVVLT